MGLLRWGQSSWPSGIVLPKISNSTHNPGSLRPGGTSPQTLNAASVRLCGTLLIRLSIENNSKRRIVRVALFHAAAFCRHAAAWGRHEERERREKATFLPSSNAAACGRREERQRREIVRIWPAPVFSCLCFMNLNTPIAAFGLYVEIPYARGTFAKFESNSN